MKDDEVDKKKEVVETERFSDVIESIEPLAREFLDNQRQALALQNRALQRDLKLDEKALDNEHTKAGWTYLLVAGFVLALVAIAVGLIFFKDSTNTGVLLLSHVVAVVMGVVGGVGWKAQQAARSDDD